jgi:hypothetical protein
MGGLREEVKLEFVWSVLSALLKLWGIRFRYLV